MTAGPDLSIITVNYNTRDILRTCLDAVQQHRGRLKIEHWVIDNASGDGSVEMVRQEYPRVKLIANEENIGPGRARNLAIPQCGGRYILSLDSDVFVHPGTLEALVDFMDRNPDAAIAGCKLLNEDRTHQHSAFHLPFILPALERRLRARLTGRKREDFSSATGPIAVGYLKGAIVIYRPAAFQQVGLFDPQFKIYQEEVDLQLRFHKAGWKNVYLPTATATHLWGRGMDQNFAECQFYREYGALWFARKHSPGWLYWYGRANAIAKSFYYSRLCSDEKLRRVFWGKSPELARRVYADVLRVSLRFRPLYSGPQCGLASPRPRAA